MKIRIRLFEFKKRSEVIECLFETVCVGYVYVEQNKVIIGIQGLLRYLPCEYHI